MSKVYIYKSDLSPKDLGEYIANRLNLGSNQIISLLEHIHVESDGYHEDFSKPHGPSCVHETFSGVAGDVNPCEYEPTCHMRWYNPERICLATGYVSKDILQQKWVCHGKYDEWREIPYE